MSLSVQHLALRAAAQWYARLCAEPDCRITREQWRQWLEHDPLHPWAWARVEQLQADLQAVPGALAHQALGNDAGLAGRRTLLKSMVFGLGIAGLGWGGYQRAPVWLADLRTGIGERRRLELDDGTRLSLNTSTAVDVRYDAGQRLILLRAGEILVETAADPRPLSVRSRHGEMSALGTRFDVRLYSDHTRLMVLEHAVAVRGVMAGEPVRVTAGMGLDFDSGSLGTPRVMDITQSEWSQGRLVVDDWRLDRTLAEVERYRSGFIHCSDEIAGLRVSGVFPLDDIDRTLSVIAQALKVRMDIRTRFWVHFRPAV